MIAVITLPYRPIGAAALNAVQMQPSTPKI
jgi:hypothetical protein